MFLSAGKNVVGALNKLMAELSQFPLFGKEGTGEIFELGTPPYFLKYSS